MAQYTVKTFASHGRLVRRLDFAAPNAHEAELAVHGLHDLRGQELWSAGRCIRTWPSRIRATQTEGKTAPPHKRVHAEASAPPGPS